MTLPGGVQILPVSLLHHSPTPLYAHFLLPHGDFQTARQLCFTLGRKAYWGSLELHHFPDAAAVARTIAPDDAVILNRPHAAARAARFFAEKFPGTAMYAVKANPSPDLLQILWDNGISHYDVASIAEVRLVRGTLADAKLCFMHPVKTAGAIREAYFTHGVKTFSLDTLEELEKIVAATTDDAGAAAQDLQLLVRLKVSSEHSELSLAAKFG